MRLKRFSSHVVCFVWSSVCWICKRQSIVYSFQTNTRISNNRKNTKRLFATTTAISSSSSGSRRRDGWGLSNKQKEALELIPVSYTHLRAHETVLDLVCRLLLEKKKRSVIEPFSFCFCRSALSFFPDEDAETRASPLPLVVECFRNNSRKERHRLERE